jgi:lipopolysaccharide/colanic/teichoic acid biosynthesis glycosyltransferase
MFLEPGAGRYDSPVASGAACGLGAIDVLSANELSGLTERDCYWRVKPWLDVLFALFLFVLAAPFICVAALLVKLTSRGPAFYSQVRLGLGGRPFAIRKLRTMYHNCERLSGPCWSTANDCRITPVGRFLRRSHIDELPQLWNVLCGEMSLVGPRPERPELIPTLARSIPGYRHRLEVRPGVTGLAQIQLPPDTDLDSVRRKLTLDLYYVRNLSLRLDLGILLWMPCYLLGISFTFAGRLLRLPGLFDIEYAHSETCALPEAAAPQQAALAVQ